MSGWGNFLKLHLRALSDKAPTWERASGQPGVPLQEGAVGAARPPARAHPHTLAVPPSPC